MYVHEYYARWERRIQWIFVVNSENGEPIELDSFARKPYREDFSIQGWKFTLVNFHLSLR